MKILIELHYLPCLEYMAILSNAEKIYLEAHENFPKQTARNRCYILSSHQTQRLSIPVSYQAPCPIGKVQIDNAQHWQKIHWRAICSAYGKAPFFTFFKDELAVFFERKYDNLWEWNVDLLKFCFKILRLNPEIVCSEAYEKQVSGEIVDMRNRFSTEKSLIGQPKSYLQVFGNDFVPNLSILDLIFCEGTQAKTYLGILGKALLENSK